MACCLRSPREIHGLKSIIKFSMHFLRLCVCTSIQSDSITLHFFSDGNLKTFLISERFTARMELISPMSGRT
uniref:Uncharacterized protein MANES_10G006700 n=1 Tax=Rhizophora mucronata TaxID=61149 RepID=A0A2P2LPX1_RHIMU